MRDYQLSSEINSNLIKDLVYQRMAALYQSALMINTTQLTLIGNKDQYMKSIQGSCQLFMKSPLDPNLSNKINDKNLTHIYLTDLIN